MNKLKEVTQSGLAIVAVGLLLAVVVVGALAFGSWIFQLLWNWVAVEVFNAPHLTFLQAGGIMLLLGFFKTTFNINRK